MSFFYLPFFVLNLLLSNKFLICVYAETLYGAQVFKNFSSNNDDQCQLFPSTTKREIPQNLYYEVEECFTQSNKTVTKNYSHRYSTAEYNRFFFPRGTTLLRRTKRKSHRGHRRKKKHDRHRKAQGPETKEILRKFQQGRGLQADTTDPVVRQPLLQGTLNSQKAIFLFDTGASDSFMNADRAARFCTRAQIEPMIGEKITMYGVDGDGLVGRSHCRAQLLLIGRTVSVKILVVEHSDPSETVDVTLGEDVIAALSPVTVHFGSRRSYQPEQNEPLVLRNPHVRGTVNGKSFSLVVDTGAQTTTCYLNFAEKVCDMRRLQPSILDGIMNGFGTGVIEVLGRCEAHVRIGQKSASVSMHVIDMRVPEAMMDDDLILGEDFIESASPVVFDLRKDGAPATRIEASSPPPPPSSIPNQQKTNIPQQRPTAKSSPPKRKRRREKLKRPANPPKKKKKQNSSSAQKQPKRGSPVRKGRGEGLSPEVQQKSVENIGESGGGGKGGGVGPMLLLLLPVLFAALGPQGLLLGALVYFVLNNRG